MLDINDETMLLEYAHKTTLTAVEYKKSRDSYASAKFSLDCILAAELPKIKAVRKNIGYDMGLIEIMAKSEHSDEIKGYYESFLKHKERAHGLQEILKARESEISLIQTLRNNRVTQHVL